MPSITEDNTSHIQTLPGKLAAEISRVTTLRAQYEAVGRLIGSTMNVMPAIYMMTKSLDNAIAAANSPDIEEQIRAIRDLETWKG